MIELSHNGRRAPREIIDAAGYIIAENSLIGTINGQKRKDGVTFKLNKTAKPRRIDITEEDSGETSLGIYELKGDQLKICYCESATVRPETFESSPKGSTSSLMVLERQK